MTFVLFHSQVRPYAELNASTVEASSQQCAAIVKTRWTQVPPVQISQWQRIITLLAMILYTACGNRWRWIRDSGFGISRCSAPVSLQSTYLLGDRASVPWVKDGLRRWGSGRLREAGTHNLLAASIGLPRTLENSFLSFYSSMRSLVLSCLGC